ncbi:uncharacterized protein LOC130648014 [Hydractinia symbiolongicarpus]|uniref:uncharacterized protein LOC130648014 n=1 Tax=Hydractinia symbiolongicarpus TaxID=13093 RepID=UPI00254AE987|nr:uncharacterized protein LOC130648014 [Hydractinia symbiolongicarpus]
MSQIYCQVELYYNKTPAIKSAPRRSDYFFAGIKISPTIIDISEKDKPAIINVTATVPVTCQQKIENCKVELEIAQDNRESVMEWCVLEFNVSQTKTIQVAPMRDFVNDGNKIMHISFHVPDYYPAVDWLNHTKIPDVLVSSLLTSPIDKFFVLSFSTGSNSCLSSNPFYINEKIKSLIVTFIKTKLFTVQNWSKTEERLENGALCKRSGFFKLQLFAAVSVIFVKKNESFRNIRTSRCSSDGDPHIKTFDNVYYDHYFIGDYVLVESKARLFQSGVYVNRNDMIRMEFQ